MLDAKLDGKDIDDEYLLAGLKIREVQNKMAGFPVSHENVLSWILSGNENKIANLVKQRLEGNTRNLDFLTTFYPKSPDLVPEQHREETEKRLSSYLKPMKKEFWDEVTSHEMTDWLMSQSAVYAKERFDEFMLNLS